MRSIEEENNAAKQLVNEVFGNDKDSIHENSLKLKALREKSENKIITTMQATVKAVSGKILRRVRLGTLLKDKCPYTVFGYLYFITCGDSIIVRVPVTDEDDWQLLTAQQSQDSLHKVVSNDILLNGKYVERIMNNKKSNPRGWRNGVGDYACFYLRAALYPMEIPCEYCKKATNCKRI